MQRPDAGPLGPVSAELGKGQAARQEEVRRATAEAGRRVEESQRESARLEEARREALHIRNPCQTGDGPATMGSLCYAGGDWNVEVLPHQGSFSAESHDQVLGTMEAIDLEVDGDVQEFLKLFHERLMDRSARCL